MGVGVADRTDERLTDASGGVRRCCCCGSCRETLLREAVECLGALTPVAIRLFPLDDALTEFCSGAPPFFSSPRSRVNVGMSDLLGSGLGSGIGLTVGVMGLVIGMPFDWARRSYILR